MPRHSSMFSRPRGNISNEDQAGRSGKVGNASRGGNARVTSHTMKLVEGEKAKSRLYFDHMHLDIFYEVRTGYLGRDLASEVRQ